MASMQATHTRWPAAATACQCTDIAGTQFRPDFGEGGDPESKGVVENLVGYAQRDLVIPEDRFGGNIAEGNRLAKLWGVEVNGRLHSEI